MESLAHSFLHLLGQNEDLLPSGVTLLVAFPEITQGKKLRTLDFFYFFQNTIKVITLSAVSDDWERYF